MPVFAAFWDSVLNRLTSDSASDGEPDVRGALE